MKTTAGIPLDLDRLFKRRAAVGRFGEMDGAGWWNTQGVLGPRGNAVYKRGLPRTHFFARVRLVTAVARDRSSSVYPAVGAATLWELTADVERALAFQERAWAADANGSDDWAAFEASLGTPPVDDLAEWLEKLGLVDPGTSGRVAELGLDPGGKGVQVPGPITEEAVQLLAAAHARGGPKRLLVPFIPKGLEGASG